MKRVLLISCFLLAAGNLAFGYVMTGAWPYDSLAIYDQGGIPIKAGSLHLSAAPTYWMADQLFDNDGKTQDLGFVDPVTHEVDPYYQSIVALPIDVGYALTDNLQLDVTLQILAPEIETESGGLVSSTGLGDLWVKGRWISPVGGGGYLGGRLAAKAPLGKSKDLAADELPLGDGQVDLDIAAVGAFEPAASAFCGNGQIGYRYRLAKSETVADPEDPTRTMELDTKKGAVLYALLEPGYGFGADKSFRVSVPILYETSGAVKLNGETVADSETSGLAVGLAPKYYLNPNYALGLKYFYPVMGKNVYKSFHLAVTYEGYIPL